MQTSTFADELIQLKSNRPVRKTSPLASLNPFLDLHGLIRIGGRLRHSLLPGAAKHPVVLSSHPLLSCLIEHHHYRTLHGGPLHTLTSLRAEFWILRARTFIRVVLHKCVRCARETAKIASELMSYQALESRVRGMPNKVYSDNGTNFHGADRELSEAYRQAIRDPNFLNSLVGEKTSWHFIPPAAPHFGGLWETGVRSIKYHLKRCIGTHTLTYEEMTTILCRIEACLNSRPIATVSENIDNYRALTPGHFLIGTPLLAVPESRDPIVNRDAPTVT
ncbi:uncharacterized protein LOC120358572 [Solenopsis invicta]|uniref:uncharacterized protein LOC120358572 n=1 Tax=Solenopsis invicta TaxID=13686 RepID=UPI00193EA17D|nr:uncharacterized protein LOC120358572 [Solenopsis invicta]